MPAAARVGDPTNHPGIIGGPGVYNVLIGGMPAAVVGTPHLCAMPPSAGPHPPTAIGKGSTSVMIGGRPAARVNDPAACGASIIFGAYNVQIGG